MKILLTNDDGIKAEGLKVLADIMSNYGDVYVVAPDQDRSAVGHGMTLNRPLKIQEEQVASALLARSVNGTPADCIKYALTFLKLEPDLVLSGINCGANVGTDILYSGTVSGAIEANLYDYPALAVSTAAANYDSVREYLPFIMSKISLKALDNSRTLNINFPAGQPKGIRVTNVGISTYENVYKEEDGGYRLSGSLIDIDQPEDTDVKTLLTGSISISPLKFNFNDEEKIRELKLIFSKEAKTR